MPPFLAQQRFRNANAAAAATQPAPAPPAVTINMANLAQSAQTAEADPNNPNNKGKVETLFGPPVGVGGTPAPEWTVLAGKAELKEHGEDEEEELTMDVVQEWIRRNKEESAGDKPVATTTLQALVNLKRPSIKLTPLTIQPPAAAASSSEETPQHPAAAAVTAAHGLEFDFDCDAARCAISIRAVVPAAPSSRASYPPATNDEKEAKKKQEQQQDAQWTTISLFDATIDGGFGKVFKFDEHGAVLELDKLDVAAAPPDADAKGTGSTPNAEGLTPAAAAAQNQHPHRKRFSGFHFRRRSMAHDAAGPALQVVDADAEAQAAAARRAAAASEAADQDDDHPAQAANQAGASKPAVADAGEDSGAKVVIRLEALDEHDKPLRSRNAQLTYLHILRMAAPSESTPASEDPSTAHRPWVVKVVKREAVIGSHTFRLQEIYGLASSSSSNSYPANTTPAVDQNDTPATECVLCLSSPREVVLLPCRHLVACRECAVNMVEFGAGGQLTHEMEGTNATGATAAGGAADGAAAEGTNGNENQAAATGGATEQPRPRRKRKAKGWFCPVCRQPYTALLRITTTPPGKRLSEDSFHAPLPATVPVIPAPPPAAHIAPTSQAADATNATATAATAAAAGATTEEAGAAGAGKLSGLLGSLSLRGKKGEAAQPSGSDAV